MLAKFFDPVSGGFFDTEAHAGDGSKTLGVLSARRKPFQDSPTPAGNSVAAIALLRMYNYTNDEGYREKAEQTMEVFAGVAGQYGIFGATYGIAGVHFSQPHTQVVVIGEGEDAERLLRAANAVFALNKTSLQLAANEAVAQNVPPALAETIAAFASTARSHAIALVCSGFTCQPPISDAEQLTKMQREIEPVYRRAPPHQYKKKGPTRVIGSGRPTSIKISLRRLPAGYFRDLQLST